MAMTAEQYLAQLQALLPQGAAWPREPGVVLTDVLRAPAEELARADARAEQLVDEADPRTTLELLVDWERVAGLPDPCFGESLTISGRRASLFQKLTELGGASRAYFISVAEAIGFTVTITEFTKHTVQHSVDHPIYGEQWNFVWQVNAPLHTVRAHTVQSGVDEPLATSGNQPLECVITALKPAHTFVQFKYN
jgi:uncharacterized protein YmfQ (DUF2313 family)